MQAVMMEKVFYGVPKNMGYYEDTYDDDEIDSEPPSPVFMKRKLRLSQVNFDTMSSVSIKSKVSKSDDNFRSAR